MANLQIKGVQDELYERIKAAAAAENRSVSQQVLFLLREYLAKRKVRQTSKTSAEALLDLSGSWEDERQAPEIVSEIRKARRASRKLTEGL